MAGGRRKKRSRDSSSSSIGQNEKTLKTSDMAEESSITNDRCMIEMLRNSVDFLRKELQEGFSKMHTDMDILRCELKAEITILKEKIKDIESSLEYTRKERWIC